MTDPRIDEVARAVERQFAGSQVAVRPCPSPEDPDIEWMLFVTDCPPSEEDAVGQFTLDLGIRLFGEASIPFLAVCVTREWLALHDAGVREREPARR